MLRSRRFLTTQQTKVKNHILAMCRRLGWNYKEETGMKTHWHKHHLQWLSAKINKVGIAAKKVSFKIHLKQIGHRLLPPSSDRIKPAGHEDPVEDSNSDAKPPSHRTSSMSSNSRSKRRNGFNVSVHHGTRRTLGIATHAQRNTRILASSTR